MPKKIRVNKPLHQDVPGTVTVTVEAFQEGDARYQTVLDDGSVIVQGTPLTTARKMLGGDEGYMRDPAHGTSHFISLKPWAKADPDKTFISIQFRFKPDHPVRNPFED